MWQIVLGIMKDNSTSLWIKNVPCDLLKQTFVLISLSTSPTVLCLGNLILSTMAWKKKLYLKVIRFYTSQVNENSTTMASIVFLPHPLWHDERQLSESSDIAILAEECPVLHNTEYQRSVRRKRISYSINIKTPLAQFKIYHAGATWL